MYEQRKGKTISRLLLLLLKRLRYWLSQPSAKARGEGDSCIQAPASYGNRCTVSIGRWAKHYCFVLGPIVLRSLTNSASHADQ